METDISGGRAGVNQNKPKPEDKSPFSRSVLVDTSNYKSVSATPVAAPRWMVLTPKGKALLRSLFLKARSEAVDRSVEPIV